MISSQINFDKRQHEARIQQLENEIHYLQENLKSMEEIQGLTDLQLQEADEEKERILAQLQELEKKVGKTRKETHESLLPGSCSQRGGSSEGCGPRSPLAARLAQGPALERPGCTSLDLEPETRERGRRKQGNWDVRSERRVGWVVLKCCWDDLPPSTPLSKLDTSVEHYFSAPHFSF